jgi:anti-sigma regulatory factor (Ser/Thr protein kinase)
MREELRTWAEGAEQSDYITMLSLEFGVPSQTKGSATFDAVRSNVKNALGLVDAELEKRDCPTTAQKELEMALEELFVNVCDYAYADQSEPGKIRIDYVYDTDSSAITVSLTDWGVPFDPLEHIDPTTPKSVKEAKIGGLGILMAKRCTDDLSYLRDDDANVVVFRKSW